MKNYFFSSLVCLILALPEAALACGGVSPPRTITLKGSSFSEAVIIELNISCDLLGAYIASRSADSEDITAENSIARFVITKTQMSCAAAGASECVDGATVPVRVNGKTVAVIETNETEAFLYSVNRQGVKDEAKPYFKFTKNEFDRPGRPTRTRLSGAGTLGPVVIRAYNNGEQNGEMTVSGVACGLRGASAGAQSGELDLSGKRYSASSGCGGASLTESTYSESPSEAQTPSEASPDASGD